MKKAKLSKEELSRVRSLAGRVKSEKKSEASRKNLSVANKVKARIFKFYEENHASE